MNARIFLVIATIKRKDQLKDMFDSLKNQTYKNFVVHVVDQNDNGLIDDLVCHYKNYFILNHHKVSFKGVSQSRTYALDFLDDSFDIVSFPDDDCVYPENCLERVASIFSNYSNLHILSGVNNSLEKYTKVVGGPNMGVLNKYNVWNNGPTYVFFYSTLAVKSIGGYDRNLGPSPTSPFMSGEDTDYSIRVINKFGNGVKDHSLKIAHPTFSVENDVDYCKCVGYSLGRMKVLRKHEYPIWFVLLNKLYPLKGLFLNFFNKKVRKYYLLQLIARL
ncbi:glycosyltransferase family 2 protein [Acinetobacter soli]|uniref:glycosyltransferase family 2 protein n=1 Tax=Acinetobacter soli TaxID=487316 RepID=UPI00300C3B50